MKKNYVFDTRFNRIEIAPATRMLLVQGEGELGIENQGRFDTQLSFSQETVAIGQHTPRIGEHGPKLVKELSAGCTLDSDSTPRFFSLESPQYVV